jgi:polysaccharide chain length determinant protein (PEP-CTERM system associated)
MTTSRTPETQQFDIVRNLLDNQPSSTKKTIDIHYYLGLIWRRRLFIIMIFCAAMILGIYLAISLPKIYQAETLIFIDPPGVPDDYVRSIIPVDLNVRLSNINQMITSQTNLMNIIERFELFAKPEQENMYIQDKIEKMRDCTTVKLITDRGKTASAFTISFKGGDPHKVMTVVNAMATLVIGQNLALRESQAIGTSQFLDEQLLEMRKRLEGVESSLAEYRKKHMGELPEELNSNLSVIDRLQKQLSEKQVSLRDEKNRLLSIGNQLQIAREQGTITGGPSLTTVQQQLTDLKSRYTDKHPDIIRLRNKISEMEKENKQSTLSEDDQNQGAFPAQSNRSNVGTIMEDEFNLQRGGVNREIEAIKNDIIKLKKQIRFYERKVEETPKIEQKLLSLNRDYENVRNTYNSLLNRKMEADISANLEKKQKGEQFRILDPARLPDKPISPDMKKLFLMGVFASLACGFGLIFLLDYFDNSVRNPEIINEKLGIPILVVMPSIGHPKDSMWRRVNMVFSIFGAVVSLALFACFAAATILNMQQMVDLIKKVVNI